MGVKSEIRRKSLIEGDNVMPYESSSTPLVFSIGDQSSDDVEYENRMAKLEQRMDDAEKRVSIMQRAIDAILRVVPCASM